MGPFRGAELRCWVALMGCVGGLHASARVPLRKPSLRKQLPLCKFPLRKLPLRKPLLRKKGQIGGPSCLFLRRGSAERGQREAEGSRGKGGVGILKKVPPLRKKRRIDELCCLFLRRVRGEM